MKSLLTKNRIFYLFLLVFFLTVFSFLGICYSRQTKEKLAPVFPAVSEAVFQNKPPSISLIAVGDVMLARSVTTKMRLSNNFDYPFEDLADLLKLADVTLVNLESPLGTDCLSTDEGMKFCADFRSVEGLIRAGVDLASLANNHALDQKKEGLEETKAILEQNFITPLGLKEPVFLEVEGIRIVFLAYNAVLPKNDLVSWAYSDVVESEIRRFKEKADVLVAFFHWGKEYEDEPMPGSGCPFDPRELAHLAIDSGADLVIGAHPHVTQGTEWYQEKLIVYSLGNFIFDQDWSQETKKGLIGKFILDKKGLVSFDLLPIEIVDYQPRLLRLPLDKSMNDFLK